MIFKPLERQNQENTSASNISKRKPSSLSHLPMTIRQLNAVLARKEQLWTIGKIVIVGRVVRVKEMVGRTLVVLTDETGLLTVVEDPEIAEDQGYFRWVMRIRMQKEEPVFYCVRKDPVQDFNQIVFHLLNVMQVASKKPQLQPDPLDFKQ